MKKILATSLMALGIAFWGAVGVTAVTAVVSTPKAEAAYMKAIDACNVTGSPYAHGAQFPGGINPWDRALYVKNIRGNSASSMGWQYSAYANSQFPDITHCDVANATTNTCAKNGATYCWYNSLGLLEFMAQSWYVTSTNQNTVAYVTLESSVCWVKYPDGSSHQFSC